MYYIKSRFLLMPNTTEAIQLIYSLDEKKKKKKTSNEKLDGVGPVDNRPSKKKTKKNTQKRQVTGDT